MADINFAHGIGVGTQTRCSSGYFYVPYDDADPFDGAGIVNTIKIDIQDIGGNDQLRLYHGHISGGVFYFYDYNPKVTLTLNGQTGWRTFTAPDDFTAFEVAEGDSIAFYAHNNDCRPGRSNTGDYKKYGYNSADPPYSSSLSLSSSTVRRIELKVEGSFVGPTETIVAKDFPMLHLESPIKAKELRSKVSGATVTHVAKDFPEALLKKGKAKELRSKWQ